MLKFLKEKAILSIQILKDKVKKKLLFVGLNKNFLIIDNIFKYEMDTRKNYLY